MMQTKVRVQIAVIFGSVAILLAFLAGYMSGHDAANDDFTIIWFPVIVSLVLNAIAPMIADSNIKHRKAQEAEDEVLM